MVTRKAPENEEENASKRRRILQEALGATLATFDDLNDDCVVKALSFLSFEDMNSFAMCSRRCHEVRSHESLDQTRSGTIIVCSEETSIRSICNAIVTGRWRSVFRGNRTHLKIENIGNISSEEALSEADRDEIRGQARSAGLINVTSLDLSGTPESAIEIEEYSLVNDLLRFVPNLEEIDVSYIKVATFELFDFGDLCPNLERIKGDGSENCFHLSGVSLRGLSELTELSLDGAHFLSTREHIIGYESTSDDENAWLFMHCYSLECLSIMDATWEEFDGSSTERHPFSQAMLMKMMRSHGNLCWLRSDLTDENVEILTRERQERAAGAVEA